ncbi:MAG TPA: hypothetical protein VIJ79_18395 [Acidobacteriaceae bacterium]
MKQCRAIPIVRSVVVLGLVSAGLTRSAASQTPQAEEPAGTSTSQNTSLAGALFAPMLPDAPGFSTTTATATAPGAMRHKVETTVSLGGSPQLTATRIENGNSGGFITQSLHPSPNIVATFRQNFRPWLGYSVNIGYTRASEHNTNDAGAQSVGTRSNFYVPNNVWELSLSHVAQVHLTHRLTGFTDEGAGFLAFQPAKRGSTYSIPYAGGCCVTVGTNFRPLIVFGTGVDYHFDPQWALRAEYRGLLYKFADYGQNLPKLITITSEPTVSLTYTFGKHTYKQ